MAEDFEVFPDMENGVLLISGELDLATAPLLQAHLDRVVNDGGGDLLVDLSECEFIDSAGLQLLVTAAERLARAHKGSLTLVRPSPQVQRLLELVNLTYSRDGGDGGRELAR